MDQQLQPIEIRQSLIKMSQGMYLTSKSPFSFFFWIVKSPSSSINNIKPETPLSHHPDTNPSTNFIPAKNAIN